MNLETQDQTHHTDFHLPAFGYTPQVALRHSSLCEVGIETIKNIARKCSPKAYEAIKDIPSNKADQISDALLGLKSEHTSEFIGSIYWIHRLIEADWFDRLEKSGHKIRSKEDVGAFCWRVLQSAPKDFAKTVDQLCGQDLGGNRNYFIFKPTKTDSRAFRTSGYRQTIDTIKSFCLEHGKRQGYGEYHRVAEYSNNDVIGYSIEHGSYRRGSVKIDSAEQAVPMMMRDVRQDLVFYHPDSKTIWVSSTAKDADFYRALLEQSLFGESGGFIEQMVFNTSFLQEQELGPLLNKARKGIGSSLRIVGATYKGDVLDPMGTVFVTAKKKECLVWSKYKNFKKFRLKNGDAHEVKLQVDMLENPKVHDSIIIQSEKIKLGRYLTEEQALTILQKLGVLKVHSNA